MNTVSQGLSYFKVFVYDFPLVSAQATASNSWEPAFKILRRNSNLPIDQKRNTAMKSDKDNTEEETYSHAYSAQIHMKRQNVSPGEWVAFGSSKISKVFFFTFINKFLPMIQNLECVLISRWSCVTATKQPYLSERSNFWLSECDNLSHSGYFLEHIAGW